MPHARIVAESPERARLLARQLEERGYTVEIVAPGAHVNTPADLEITATAHTALAEEEIFAAPGSVLGLTEYEPQERPLPEYYVMDDQPPSAGSSLREALGQTRQAFAEGWRTVAGPLSTRVAAYRAKRAQQQETERAQRERRRAEVERARAEQAEKARLARIAAEQERQRGESRRAEQERLARMAAEQEANRRAEAAEAARLAEIAAEKEQARLRAIELERERTQSAARRMQQEETRRLAAYEQDLIRRAAEDRRRREAERRREREAARIARLEIRPPAASVPEPPQTRRWKAAVAAAASVSALAVLALFFASERQPAAPVSNQTIVESEAVEQQVPFGAATALPSEAVLQKAANPSPSTTDAPKPRPQKRRVFRAESDAGLDEGEPEVIIRRSKRPPQAAQQASEVRRITDEDFEHEEDFE